MMLGWGAGAKSLVLGTFLVVTGQIAIASADAASNRHPSHHTSAARAAKHPAHAKVTARTTRHARGGISCVPFARSDSGIAVAGNAWQWWENASGVYARGSLPEPGSVLTFRSNGRMRLGHVAVVTRIINPREIEIEHANWAGSRGGVARNIPVVDVSTDNDWTAVRVGLGQSGQFGSVYPTYGFIYDRPDNGVVLAASGAPAPQPELNPAPSDLRPASERGWQTYEEVAEAPVAPKRLKRTAHTAPAHVRHVAAKTKKRH